MAEYLWVKALHIIAIICWMAGLLYLPRLFVYHAGAQVGSELDMTFRKMEFRLLWYIMTPSMFLSVIFGLILIHYIGFVGVKWLHIKLFCVMLLLFLHGIMIYYTSQFARGSNIKSQRFFRIMNEIPAVLMIFIVILAVVKF